MKTSAMKEGQGCGSRDADRGTELPLCAVLFPNGKGRVGEKELFTVERQGIKTHNQAAALSIAK